MKRAMFFAVPFALALVLTTARADDNQWTGTVGCGHCDYSKDSGATECCPAFKVGDKVFLLKGDAVTKDYHNGGQWTVKGTISADGKSITVTSMEKKA